MKLRAVILAAGASKRMGAQKLLMPFRGRRMIDAVIEAAAPFDPLVVASPDVAQALAETNATPIVNECPERGMSYSLALADAEIEKDVPIVVLLADKPLVTRDLIERICGALGSADVAYPVHPKTGEPGHPVAFSAKARSKIARLPDGDSLRMLRDDPSLARVTVETVEAGAFFDVDTPDALSG